MKCIAIIPARSGSKGLKDKNIKELAGRPLMAYSIESAEKAGIFDRIHVSTDSEVYADIARKNGGDVPFLRSRETSSDSTGSWEVVKEVLGKYKNIGQEFDMVTLLQPTSPLRTAEDILSAYKLYNEKRANAVVSICEMEHCPLWANTLPEDGSMDSFLKNRTVVPRQQLQTYYRINGAIYMVSVPYLLNYFDIYKEHSFSYIMPKERSVDIDTQFDFDMAEFLLKKRSDIEISG